MMQMPPLRAGLISLDRLKTVGPTSGSSRSEAAATGVPPGPSSSTCRTSGGPTPTDTSSAGGANTLSSTSVGAGEQELGARQREIGVTDFRLLDRHLLAVELRHERFDDAGRLPRGGGRRSRALARPAHGLGLLAGHVAARQHEGRTLLALLRRLGQHVLAGQVALPMDLDGQRARLRQAGQVPAIDEVSVRLRGRPTGPPAASPCRRAPPWSWSSVPVQPPRPRRRR